VNALSDTGNSTTPNRNIFDEPDRRSAGCWAGYGTKADATITIALSVAPLGLGYYAARSIGQADPNAG
jgi:hypothetical protein